MNTVGAIFSDDRKYRYLLWRVFDGSKPMVMYVGLNPSTANENVNDATIKKLMKITKNNGFGGFYMTNLFGIISSKPEILLTDSDPIGDNNAFLHETAITSSAVVYCWGSFKQAYKSGRVDQVMILLDQHNPLCIRKTKSGNPWHPLYCLDNEQFIKF